MLSLERQDQDSKGNRKLMKNSQIKENITRIAEGISQSLMSITQLEKYITKVEFLRKFNKNRVNKIK